jgi:hypothetical protein
MLKSLAQAKSENTEIINTAKLEIVIIQYNMKLSREVYNNAVNIFIIRKIRFMYQTCTYHFIKDFSHSVKSDSSFILLFTKGAKNITQATAESLASDEMMFLSVSIINN